MLVARTGRTGLRVRRKGTDDTAERCGVEGRRGFQVAVVTGALTLRGMWGEHAHGTIPVILFCGCAI